MFKIRIRSGKKSQQNGEYQHDEYSSQEEYDYIRPQGGTDRDNDLNDCCICGGSIISGHLEFEVKGKKKYFTHVSCLITGLTLATRSITLLVGLFRHHDKQFESEDGMDM
jgi:hypothetical protein